MKRFLSLIAVLLVAACAKDNALTFSSSLQASVEQLGQLDVTPGDNSGDPGTGTSPSGTSTSGSPTSGSTTPPSSPKPPTMSDDDSSSDSKDDDAKECSAKEAESCGLPAGTQMISISGNKQSSSFDASKPVIVKVSGNQGSLKLHMSADKALDGICIINAGNQGMVQVQMSADAKSIRYVGEGNLTTGAISFDEGVVMDGSMSVFLAGNQNTLKISGPGSFQCPKPVLSGGAGNALSCN